MEPIRTTRTYRGETYNVRAGASDFKTLLGLDPSKHLPAEGLPLRTVEASNGAYRMFVKPAAPPVEKSRWNYRTHRMEPGLVKRSTHRVYVICDCGREVPAGRLHQHICR
jgi:hypothetical protein